MKHSLKVCIKIFCNLVDIENSSLVIKIKRFVSQKKTSVCLFIVIDIESSEKKKREPIFVTIDKAAHICVNDHRIEGKLDNNGPTEPSELVGSARAVK